MPVNSRRKGRNGELQLVNLLKSLGFPDARRTAQVRGKTDGCADVECPDTLPRVHIEVKTQQRREIDLGVDGLGEACHQAMRDANGNPWCVLWRPTGCSQWRMTFDCGWRITLAHNHEIAAALEWLQAHGPKLVF